MAAPTVADRLDHVVDAIDAIARYTADRTEAEFAADPMRRDAVERNLVRLCEASRHVPDDFAALFPDVPWRRFAALGDALQGASRRIATSRIWPIIVNDLAPLRAAAEGLSDSVD